MKEIMQQAWEWFHLYIGNGYSVFLFVAAILGILLLGKKKENQKLFVLYTCAFVFLYACPLTAKVIMDYCIGRNVYWRMFWILPIPVIVAYAGTLVITHWTKAWKRAAAGIAIVALIAGTGQCIYTSDVYAKTDNLQKLPTEAIHLADSLKEDWNQEGVTLWAVIPQDLVGYVRQYDAQIGLSYNRWGGVSAYSWDILYQMGLEDTDYELLQQRANDGGYDYLVIAEEKAGQEQLANLGCQQVQIVDGYVIYRLPDWNSHEAA